MLWYEYIRILHPFRNSHLRRISLTTLRG